MCNAKVLNKQAEHEELSERGVEWGTIPALGKMKLFMITILFI